MSCLLFSPFAAAWLVGFYGCRRNETSTDFKVIQVFLTGLLHNVARVEMLEGLFTVGLPVLRQSESKPNVPRSSTKD
jgi:hypothetical protein